MYPKASWPTPSPDLPWTLLQGHGPRWTLNWLSVDTALLRSYPMSLGEPALSLAGYRKDPWPASWTDPGPARGSFGVQVDASSTQPLQPWQTGGWLVAAAIHPGALAHFLWDTPEVLARPERGTEAAHLCLRTTPPGWGESTLPGCCPSRACLVLGGDQRGTGSKLRRTPRQLLSVCGTRCLHKTCWLRPKPGQARPDALDLSWKQRMAY